jgi:DNA-binding response OmpR family regulator
MATSKSVLLVGSCSELAGNGNGAGNRAVEVFTAKTAAEALLRHRADPADLIALDLDPPDMSAEQFCDTIRADEQLRNVSLLVLCGPGEDDRLRAAGCRANAHIVRPVDAAALSVEIGRLLAVSSRASYRVLAQVSVDEPSSARSFFCTSQNVSTSGILLETEEELSPGQLIACSFFLPGKVRVEARGRVVRHTKAPSGGHFGVQFLALPSESATALEQFIGAWRSAR